MKCALIVSLLAWIISPLEGSETNAKAPFPNRAPLAHWTFNAEGPTNLFVASADLGKPAAKSTVPLPVTRGIEGNALRLAGSHALAVGRFLPARELPAITFSAWVRLSSWDSYNEIFRQECDRRLLFSFQEHGTVLSLGLNIGGYVECDAPLRPEQVLDGAWHHCAATFDGTVMRVYLDGRLIGSLARPGRIALDPEVTAFIASNSGTSEHLQGALDDLRIYEVALSEPEIQAIYQRGADAALQALREMEKMVGTLYTRGSNFATTLAASRQRLHGQTAPVEEGLAGLLAARLKADFPLECERFASAVERDIGAFLTHREADYAASTCARLVELMMEYRPLTEEQWRRQSAEDRRLWAEADAIQQRFERLRAQGVGANDSPEWVDLILLAGAKIQPRPRQHEAVAPYLRPATPEPRTRTSEEGRLALERDWLHQADNKFERARSFKEIQWARELVARLRSSGAGDDAFARELAQLDQLQQQATQPGPPNRELYLSIRRIKRAIMFKNPVLDFSQVLFVDMPFPQGSEWQHETRHRLGYMAVPGGRLLVLDGLAPDGRLRQLMPQAPLHGSFWRPDLSWDATRVLFCFKPHNEKAFHLYEIGLDGSGLRQLTDGPYDDLDPIYLPDGQHLMFSTTRGHTYVRCMPPTSAFVLARCKNDGNGIYLVSANNEPDYLPSVMQDGRVVYTRWEYTDKPLWRAQKLWTVNPDGTQVNTLWGNQSVWPDVVKDARSIPGSRRVMFTGSAHHNWFAGSVGIIDPDQGFNFPHGIAKITADTPWPETGNGPVDPVESPRYHASGHYEAYYSPYPLSERDFLVSAQRAGKFVLYLMDVDGNRELIYEGDHHIFHALPVRPRQRPPMIQDRVAWPSPGDSTPPRDGVIYSRNVFQGAPAELQGKARYLRIWSIDHKTYTYWYKRPYISTGPVVSAVQSEGVKRLLGTVPIKPDGSVAFAAPAGVPLHFQLLDESHRALQTMRSFVNVMPGEYRGCLGCHESHSRAPVVAGAALSRTAPPITPPPWPDTTVSYPRYVQPVLDRYCGKCHQGDGEARKVLDLAERPSQPVFTEPYLTLIGRPTWGQPYLAPAQPPPGFGIAGTLLVEGYGQTDPKGYVTPPPMTALSYRSPLIDLVSSGKHHDVKVDEISRLRLIAWVDAMCPYMGDDEIRQMPDPIFQGVDWLSVRPKIANAPRIQRPGPVD